MPDAQDRADRLARDWRVVVEYTRETETSILKFGRRDGTPVVLKVMKTQGDEWRSGEILAAFGGRGAARVYETTGGAILLERLTPGTSLVETALSGRDDEATGILAGVIAAMSPRGAVDGCPRVEDWAASFARYRAGSDARIPRALVEEAHAVYHDLCASQTRRRLLHGDLHHYNVLLDSDRGWLAVDPKGVIGEIEYEIGAALRNPIERPELFTPRATVERRLRIFASRLPINAQRALAWAFAQAVLSAIWGIEDGFEVGAETPALVLAETIRPLLPPQDTGGLR